MQEAPWVQVQPSNVAFPSSGSLGTPPRNRARPPARLSPGLRVSPCGCVCRKIAQGPCERFVQQFAGPGPGFPARLPEEVWEGAQSNPDLIFVCHQLTPICLYGPKTIQKTPNLTHLRLELIWWYFQVLGPEEEEEEEEEEETLELGQTKTRPE